MPHIALPEGVPGIVSGFAFRPETAKPMRELAHILLHGPNSLSPAERELIATYLVSEGFAVEIAANGVDGLEKAPRCARPVIFYPRGGTCMQPYVQGTDDDGQQHL